MKRQRWYFSSLDGATERTTIRDDRKVRVAARRSAAAAGALQAFGGKVRVNSGATPRTRRFRQIPLHIFILLSGFLFGNLFPTFFGDFLGKIFTPIFIIVVIDSFNSFYYEGVRATPPSTVPRATTSSQVPRGTVWTFGSSRAEPRGVPPNIGSLEGSVDPRVIEISRDVPSSESSIRQDEDPLTFLRTTLRAAAKSLKRQTRPTRHFVRSDADPRRVMYAAHEVARGLSKTANSFKIGFLFGLFVDAFKVGS